MVGLVDRVTENQAERARMLKVVDPASRYETLTESRTITADDDGKTFLIGTDALVVTLPLSTAPGIAGIEVEFVNIGADGNNIITISPAAADGINGIITLAASVVKLSGTVNKDLINTKASATTGDSARLMATPATDWVVKSSTGIWASEA